QEDIVVHEVVRQPGYARADRDDDDQGGHGARAPRCRRLAARSLGRHNALSNRRRLSELRALRLSLGALRHSCPGSLLEEIETSRSDHKKHSAKGRQASAGRPFKTVTATADSNVNANNTTPGAKDE